MQMASALHGRNADTANRWNDRKGIVAMLGMALLMLFVPTVQAQIKNGGFETQNFSEWKLESYTRSTSAISTVPPTNSSQLTLGSPTATVASTNTVNTAFSNNVRVLNTPGTAANTNNNGARYPFSGVASALLGGSGARSAYAMEQEATMALSDVDPVDGKVHIRFAMAPVLNNPGHNPGEQPFFFVEVINLTKGNTQLFNTFNYSNQPGIPWQQYSTGGNNYQFTNWQGFDIAPGNGRLDVGDQIRLKVYVANCSLGAANHTAQIYMDVFGSKMPGLSVAATGPSTTKPGEQVTYTYNYVNNSGVYALGSTVRLAAPITENGLHLSFVQNSWPATCTGPHAGTAPRAEYIECPVGDLVAGAGGSFPVTFTVPAGAATTGPNNVINNGDYDVRANTVSPFIGPLVKTTISPGTTTLVDLGITVSNGSVPSYLVGGAVAYTVTVTNHGPVAANGATVSQTLSGANGTASWSCAVPGGSTASCGATSSGSGPISTATANLPVGQSLVYTVNGITAAAAGTPVVTVVSVATPAGMSDSVSANNTDGLSTPVTAVQHRLTAHTIGAGMGRINAIPAAFACPSGGARTACSTDNLGENQEAYLNAIADNGSLFKGWTGGCTTVTGNECYVQMGTQDLNVTAEFAKVWIVTPSITGGTLNNPSPQVVEDGQGTSFTLTPTTPGHIPAITTPGGANTCPGTLSGPSAGVYTYTVTPVTEDCAFHVTFASQPRLTISKTASVVAPASVAVGVPFDYTVTVTNTGTVATSATATVTDVVPTGLTIGSLPAGCVTNPGGSQTVVCTIASGLSNVSPINVVSFVIPVTPQGVVANTTVSNSATVTGGGDPTCASAGNCVSTTVDTPVAASSLAITKTAPATATAAVPYDYTLTVTNSGTAATSAAATVTDVIPTGLTIGTLPAGCVVNPSGSQTVECTIASGLSNVAPANTVTYVIPVTPMVNGTVSNTATVTGGGDPDCASGCDSATVDTWVNAAQLNIYKSGPAAAVVGAPFDYTLRVENMGNADASVDATVTDTVPGNVVVNSATPNCTIVGRDVSCVVAMADLPRGGEVTITINVTPIAAGNASNTATVTGGGDPVCVSGCDTPPVTTTIADQAPSMTVVKSVTSTGPYGVGSVIAYQFIVTNTGNVTLTGIVVNDAQLDAPAVCAATTLAVGASTTCTGAHTVTAAEVATGNVHNSATVTGQPPTPPGGPTPPTVTSPPSEVDTATAQAPSMTVVKSVTSTGPYGVGSVIAYQFLVTNTGDVTLSGIVVNDALLDTPAVCVATTLVPGANTTCTGVHTVTAADVAVGHVHNSATVTGQPPTPPGGPTPPTVTSPPSEVDTATAQNPALSVVKSVTSTGPYGVGSAIAYQFLVTNTGDVTLSGIVVNDAQLDAAAVCPSTTLAPGASTACTGVHTVTAAEVAVGNVHNSATVTGQPPTPPGGPTPPTVTSPPSTVDTATEQAAALSVVKSVTSTGPYGVGSVIAYQFIVTNTGNVTLSGVVVNDAQLDAPAVCPSTTLLPGTSTACTGVHTVTAAEVAAGNVHNSATATGQPPTPPGGVPPTPITSPPSTVDTPTAQAPSMTVVKSVTSTGPYGVGSVIAYQFVVTNTGDVILSGVVVNDALLDAPATCVATTLAPGANTTCTGVHTVTAADVAVGHVHNSATVTGQPPTPPGGPTPPTVTSPPSTVDTATAQNPALSVVKSVTSTGPYGVGSVIAYQFLVTNTGDVTLSGVVVNDAQLDTAAVCPSTTLSPGASTACTGTYTVTAADVAVGNVHNSATVTGQPPTPPGGPTPPTVTSPPSEVDTATAQNPALSVVKSVTSTGPYGVGSVIAYQFAVTNTGNVILTGVVVNDAQLDAPAVCAATTLAPGAGTTCTGVHTVTAAEVAVGNVHNSATVTGQPPTPPGGPTPPTVTSPPSTVDTATEQSPAVTLSKSVTSTGPYRAGSVIAYQFDVENTGNVILTDVSVIDTLSGLSPLTYAWPGTAGQLQPGERVVANATYTVTSADVLAGQVHNSATATGRPPTPPGGTSPPDVSSPPSVVDTVILPMVDAVDDVLAAVDGASGNPSAGNAYDNDVINGVVVDPARITGTVTTPATAINGGPVPTLDPASGVVSVPAGTPAGTYTIGYRICETLTPDNCDDAVVTVTVVATTLDAVDDTFVPIRSGTGGTSPSVLGNDTLGGGPAQIGEVTLVPGSSPHAGLVMNPDGTVTIAVGTPPGTYRYPYTLCEVLNPSNCDTADAIVVVDGEALLRVTKTAGVRDVRTGDLVRYTVSVENLGDGPVVDGSIVDTPPAGFSYVEGSLTVSDGDNAATVSGQHPVRFEGLDIPVGGNATLMYAMRVGAGARAGTLVNQAQAVSSSGEPLSNVATADVMLVADTMVEDSLLFGTVFNDRDGDGWQDGATLSGVRVQGGFAPETYVAGSTTLDRGTGPQSQADASAPLLHGIALGMVEGRQSDADPVRGRQVVIRQTLRELSFTDDFVLTSDQGVTLRMDRNGVTSLETTGDAAKGLTAAMPTVERRVAQGDGGYIVDYLIGNAGIEERGVPGVRIATVEGLLIETDQFGRYHLAGMSGGTWERGRNVVMKVDPSTLPAGTRMTTDNPLLRRVTPGVPVRFDWGVVLPEQVIDGGREQLELELGEVHFAPGSAALPPRYQSLVGAMADKVREHHGGEVVIQAEGDSEGLAFDRANAVKDALLALLDGATAKALTVSVRARPEAPASLVTGVRDDTALLGTVLFDTDKATVRAEFAPLLDAIAAALERKGGGSVVIVGHADRRGSHAYNSVLGMQRAKAVFDALAGRLSASARAALRVEIENDPVAPNGARK
ncbi:OmpA family protein [Pseudoxanthomonas sp. PXM02]|uniref:DUF7507 domain-containing protein n=1 Tax=Pseudoxanthomonas sp. PXM02 TaxID=2769294 RepID=UPI0017810DC2|nr:OmpA family protein [Pseudoxanthomonas sp. PXM02]MBD9480014.1 DUF11 domain-containing protein [Pseudoxanthomonas sp. PXM02]